METRRRKTGTGLVRAAPAKTRLADVVCRFGNAAGKSVDWRPDRQTAAGLPRCRPIARTQPVSDKPPRYVRAMYYRYRFTTPSERRQTGAWWKRQELREYLPTVSLDQLR